MARKLNVAKKQHRERGQPANRQKLGLLEKHQDYVKRARDYHSKQDRIKVLRSKAAARNKDEFYFGMHTHRTKKGVHIQASSNSALSTETVKLLKTQDLKYVEMKKKQEEKTVQKLEEQIATAAATPASGKHVQFTETLGDLRHPPKPKRTSKSPKPAVDVDALEEERDARQQRLQSLAQIQRDIEVQKTLMGKGRRKEVVMGKKGRSGEEGDPAAGGVKPGVGLRTGARVFKWKTERKK